MINGIDATDPISGLGQKSAPGDLGKNDFMTLLVSQLRNQNPLDPTDGGEFVAQLAQFSSLQEMTEMNDNIVGLAVLQQGNALLSQLTDSSVLIGRNVLFTDPETGDTVSGIVDSVKIRDGLAVLNIEGEDIPLVNVIEVTGDVGTTGSEDDGSDEDSDL